MSLFPNYDCVTCTGEQKIERGCTTDRVVPWYNFENKKQMRCPRRPIFEDPTGFNKVIGAYNGYKAGFLPHTGGMNDQPAKFLKTMSVVESAQSKCEEEMNRRKSKRSDSSGSGAVSILGKRQ